MVPQTASAAKIHRILQAQPDIEYAVGRADADICADAICSDGHTGVCSGANWRIIGTARGNKEQNTKNK